MDSGSLTVGSSNNICTVPCMIRNCNVVCGGTVVGHCFTLPSGGADFGSVSRVGDFGSLGTIIRSVATGGSGLGVRNIFTSASLSDNRS